VPQKQGSPNQQIKSRRRINPNLTQKKKNPAHYNPSQNPVPQQKKIATYCFQLVDRHNYKKMFVNIFQNPKYVYE